MKAGLFVILFLFSLSSIANTNAHIDICDRGYIADFIVGATQSRSCSEVDREKMEQLKVLKVKSFVTVRCDRARGGAKECLPLNKKSFSGLKNLKELRIIDTQIGGIPEGTFFPLKKLETLIIEWNNRLELERGSFKGLNSLKELFIYGSIKESDLKKRIFSPLTNLQNLWLSNVVDTHLPPYTFEGLENLKRLFITNNHLFRSSGSVTKESFFGLNNLEYLKIDSPSLINYSTGTVDSMVFSELKSLKHLSLKEMRIGYFEDKAFEGLKELESLDLTRNLFKELSPEMFGNANIEKIDVNYNCLLDTIEDGTFSGMNSLSFFNAMKTRITPNYISSSADRIGLKEGTKAYAEKDFCL